MVESMSITCLLQSIRLMEVTFTYPQTKIKEKPNILCILSTPKKLNQRQYTSSQSMLLPRTRTALPSGLSIFISCNSELNIDCTINWHELSKKAINFFKYFMNLLCVSCSCINIKFKIDCYIHVCNLNHHYSPVLGYMT